MGRRKVKPFIDKKNAEHFVLMHRSQNDPKYYEEGASKYVLMSTRASFKDPAFHSIRDGDTGEVFFFDDEDKAMMQQHVSAAGGGAGDEGGFTDAMYAAAAKPRKAKRGVEVKTLVAASVDAPNRRGIKEFSEVDDMGFPLDGYDYSQHMRPMGGGTFMSSAGQMLSAGVNLTHSIAAKMDIPADVLPSRTDEPLEGMVEAINLRPDTLPSDILEAMEALDELDEGDELDVEDAGSVLEAITEGEEDADDEDGEGEGEADEEGAGGATPKPKASKARVSGGGAGEDTSSAAAEDDAATDAGSSAASAADASTAPSAAAKKLAKKKRAVKAADVERAGLEWLDDHFVLQAAGEMPIGDEEEGAGGGATGSSQGAEGGGFDFQAHIARLMAAAEGKWTDTNDDFDDDEWDDDDEDGEYDDDEDEEDEAAYAAARGRYTAPAAAAPQGSRPDDRALAALLAQYDDDEIGELADDDPRLRSSLWGRKEVEKALGGSAAGASAGDSEDEEGSQATGEGEEDEEDDDDSAGGRGGKGSAARGDGSLLGSLLDEYLRTRESNRIDALYEAGVKLTRDGRNGRFAVAGAEPGSDDDEGSDSEQDVGPRRKGKAAAAAPAPAPASSGFAVKIGLFAPKKAAPVEPAEPAPAAAAEEDEDDECEDDYDEEAPGELPSRAARRAARLAGLANAEALDAEKAAEAPDAEPEYVPFGFADGDFQSVVDAKLLSRAAKAKPKWDAQTIVSTYTNTENHPRMLTSDSVSIVSKRGGAAPQMLTTGSALGGVAAAAAGADGAAPTIIRLSKKTGLPIVTKAPAPAAGGASSDSDSDSGSEGDDLGSRPAGIVAPRQRGETAEERRARKALVKEERRARRETKKAVKVAFKEEEVRQTAALKRKDVLAGAKIMH